jgi:hypothetical protein
MSRRGLRTVLVGQLAIVAAACQILVSPSLAFALPVWDLAGDWSDSANPNSVWSYNEGSNSLPHVDAWNGSSYSTPQPAWARSEAGNTDLPAWFLANGTQTFVADFQAGDIVMHSTDGVNGVGAGVANVTWTSPIAGLVDISGFAWNARDIGRSNQWTLLLNGAVLTTGSVASGDAFDRSNPFFFSNGSGGASALDDVLVAVGDVVTLEIANTSQFGDFVGDLAYDRSGSRTVYGDPADRRPTCAG